jgi:hypothetical protein
MPDMSAGRLFDEQATPWRAWSPEDVTAHLETIHASSRPLRWAVAAGWAIDLHLGRVTRPHSDLEIVLLDEDSPAVLAAFSEPAWRWEIPIDGRLYPRNSAAFEESHQTWLWSEQAQGFVLDIFRDRHEGETWLCRRDETIRRPWSEVVCRTPTGIPYLAPEIVLLFKAKHAREKDVQDLHATLPAMSPDRRAWLRSALQQVHPGHAWLDLA